MNHIFANFYFLGESFFWDVMMMYFSIHPNLEFGEKISVFLWGWWTVPEWFFEPAPKPATWVGAPVLATKRPLSSLLFEKKICVY